MNDLFRLLAESIPFPLWIKDRELRFIFVNKSYAEMNNMEVEDIVGRKNEDIYEARTSKVFTAYSKKALEKGKVLSGKMYTNKGYKESTVIPIKDENGTVIAIYGITTDINEIKEKDEEIKFQRNLTNKIMDILPGMVFYKDKEGKYVYANKECKEFYRDKGIENMIGKKDSDLNLITEYKEKFLEEDKEVIKSKIQVINEVKFNDEKGRAVIKEILKMPMLDENGEVKGIIGRALDITEIKNIQSRLEYLSYVDILTGVKNRTFFEEQEIEFSKEENLPLGVIMGDVNGLKLLNDTFGHYEGDKLLREVAKIIKEVCKGIGEVFRIGGDEFVILIPNADLKYCENIITKIVDKCDNYEDKFFNISIALGAAVKNDSKKDLFEVLKEAEDKVYRKKLLQNKSIKNSIFNLLKLGLAVRSVETEQHTERVMVTAEKIGKKLGLEKSIMDELILSAELHDIGKIGVSESILTKPSKLTEEEYAAMKKHSEIGYRIIMASSELKTVAESILYHHERWDGMGYPMGLKGKEIPLLARIVTVCDCYDVMINKRVYKEEMKKEDAIKELEKCSGKQFDPEIVKLLIEMES